MKIANGMMCAVLAGAMWMGGCATTAPMSYTRLAPSAAGVIEFEEGKGENGNNLVTLTVSYMPPPERLSEDVTTYVVWMRAQGSQAYANFGQLVLNDDRTGESVMTTPFSKVEIVVTAEAEAIAGAPSANVVLTGSYPAAAEGAEPAD